MQNSLPSNGGHPGLGKKEKQGLGRKLQDCVQYKGWDSHSGIGKYSKNFLPKI